MATAHATDQSTDISTRIEALDASVLLQQLKSAFSNASILIFTHDHRIVFANEPSAVFFQGQTADSLPGMSLNDLLEDSCMQARAQQFAHPVKTGRTAVVLEIMNGFRMCSRFIPLTLNAPFEDTPLIMWALEPITQANLFQIRQTTPPEDLYAESCFDLGVLNCLSDRELEVLALMGHGLRTKEIADRLSRSLSTINRHRESIGEKLQITDRAVLIRLANLAVLEVEDAGRMRNTIKDLGLKHPPHDAVERAESESFLAHADYSPDSGN